MANKKIDLVKWMETAERLPTRRCITCEEPWKSAVDQVLEEMASGRVGKGVTFAGLWRFLRDPDNFDPVYPLSLEALRAHVRAHCAEKYREWVLRGR